MTITQKDKQKIKDFSGELAPLYKFLNWDWAPDRHIPNAQEIEIKILELIKDFSDKMEYVESGGLKIKKTPFGGIEISFNPSYYIYLNEE